LYRVLLFCLGWPGLWSSYLYFCIAGMTGVHYNTQLFIGWNGVLLTLCLDWPWTAILPFFASWVGRIIKLEPPSPVSHPTLLMNGSERSSRK
jgi:hypothetical protein